MHTKTIRFAYTNNHRGVRPEYQTEGSAGFDLTAGIDGKRIVPVGRMFLCPTGLIIEIPKGYEGQVRPRSGLAIRAGLTVLNAPGTIDSDYRGEISVPLINLGDKPVEVKPGDRVAQMVIAAYTQAQLSQVYDADVLTRTNRGKGGFGSTGTS